MIGYEKPFRSWGVACLIKKVAFVTNSTGTIYQFAKGITSVLRREKMYLV
jgi:hypothetical protein